MFKCFVGRYYTCFGEIMRNNIICTYSSLFFISYYQSGHQSPLKSRLIDNSSISTEDDKNSPSGFSNWLA